MNNKLTYVEYKGCKDIITIDIHNGYTVIAIKSYCEDHYSVELRLKRNDVERWDSIEEAESITFKCEHRCINTAILKQVAHYLSDRFFNRYINRYDYELKCFEVGNDMAEKERLGEK